MPVWIDVIGWCGAFLVLLAYALISAKKVFAHDLSYQWMNIIGAACFIVNSGSHGAFPSVITNIIWIIIGLYTLVKMKFKTHI